MKINNVTRATFKEMVANAPRPAVVVFSSPACHLCDAVKPVIEELASDYKNQLLFYTVNVIAEQKLASTFLDEGDGVPTIVIFRDKKYKKLPEPAEADPVSWYSRDFLKENFNKYIEKKKEVRK
tara:strand:+ start:371 stop:742 length:372 start_codon:yes stop_codon:yes gene_type:complete